MENRPLVTKKYKHLRYISAWLISATSQKPWKFSLETTTLEISVSHTIKRLDDLKNY